MQWDFNGNWAVQKVGSRETGIVNLPHDAMIHEQRYLETNNGERTGFYPGGCYLYTKELNVSDEMRERQVLLHFDGVYGDTTVFVNGQTAGTHQYGFTEFEVDITDKIKTGKNQIAVQADNSYTPNCRWYSGSGVIRPVYLIVRSKRHLVDVKIITRCIEPVKVEATAAVFDSEANAYCIGSDIQVKILEDDRILYEGPSGLITLENVKLWSENTPWLYHAVLQCDSDQIELDFGIRKLS